MTQRTITVDTKDEPFRTEIEHNSDGTIIIRQHSFSVTRTLDGVEVGRSQGYRTATLAEKDADKTTTPAFKDFLASVPDQAGVKPQPLPEPAIEPVMEPMVKP